MIWLASTSPRRREIIRALGIPCRFANPGSVETELLVRKELKRNPVKFALAAAVAKARSAAVSDPAGLVIGVDTIVVIDKTILGKPRSAADARAMLSLLSGRTHRVISGLAVFRPIDNRIWTGSETSRVAFRLIPPAALSAYLATAEPYDKAGAYAIQGWAAEFVRSVRGCYLNIVGLPVSLLLELLERAGWSFASSQGPRRNALIS